MRLLRPNPAFAVLFSAAAALATGACSTQSAEGPDIAATGQPSQAQTADPQAIEQMLARADSAREAGADGDAKAYYNAVLRQAPNNRRAVLGAADIALAEGRGNEVRETFSALAIESTPPAERARAEQGLGIALMQNGRTQDALPHLHTAVDLDPSLWRAWNALGVANDRLRRFDAAEAAYAKALDLRPGDVAIHNNLGFSRLLQGRHDEAMAPLLAAARDGGRDATALPRTNLRLGLAWQGRYDDAVAGASTTERPVIFNNVGYIAMLRGDHAEAEALFARAQEASPAFFEPARLNLNHLRALRGKNT